MEILSERQRVIQYHYEIFFQYTGEKYLHGYGFQALESGEIDLESLKKKPQSLANYYKCLNKEIAVDDPCFKKWEHSYTEPAIGKCYCEAEVVLDRFTNTCDCGRDYNMSGQLLASRECWGEETGESYSDLMDI